MNIPQIGEVWYVRRRGAISLATVEVTDQTESTIAVRSKVDDALEERYTYGSLEFIERVAAAPVQEHGE